MTLKNKKIILDTNILTYYMCKDIEGNTDVNSYFPSKNYKKAEMSGLSFINRQTGKKDLFRNWENFISQACRIFENMNNIHTTDISINEVKYLSNPIEVTLKNNRTTKINFRNIGIVNRRYREINSHFKRKIFNTSRVKSIPTLSISNLTTKLTDYASNINHIANHDLVDSVKSLARKGVHQSSLQNDLQILATVLSHKNCVLLTCDFDFIHILRVLGCAESIIQDKILVVSTWSDRKSHECFKRGGEFYNVDRVFNTDDFFAR